MVGVGIRVYAQGGIRAARCSELLGVLRVFHKTQHTSYRNSDILSTEGLLCLRLDTSAEKNDVPCLGFWTAVWGISLCPRQMWRLYS